MGVALHSEILAYFATSWQGLSGWIGYEMRAFGGFPRVSLIWHGPCLTKRVTPMVGAAGAKTKVQGDRKMFSFDRFARVATAAVGALVLSTISLTAAVGPIHVASGDTAVFASARTGSPANV
jgi:hypothetical protein